LAGLLIAIAPADPQVADASANKKRHEQIKAEMERKQADLKRKVAEMERKHADLKHKLPKSSPPPPPPGFEEQRRKVEKSLADKAAAKKAAEQASASFNLATAPSPEDCWRSYVSTARSATTFDPILKYLPLEKAHSLREQQAAWDPRQAAESKASWRKRDPKMSEETLEHLTSSPYAHGLKWHKEIAEKYIAIIGVNIEGNKATLRVSTHSDAVINGGRYPYGTATVELLGQANFWRLDSYNDSNIVYQEPPQR